MAGQGTLATTLITTKGLFTIQSVIPVGFSALYHGAGITPFFSLYIESDVPSRYTAAAGSKVYAPGEIAHLFQPIDPKTGLRIDANKKDGMEEYLVVPIDKEAEFLSGSRIITVKLSFAGKNMEKVYSVNEHRARTIIEVINVINATKSRISVVASGLKRVTTEAVVKIRNLRLSKKRDK